MVYLIKGWARIYLEDIGEIRVETGDVWFQAPGVKHEVLEYSDDWEVMEITMPAELGVSPRSELMIAFSTTATMFFSHGVTVSVRASSTPTLATCASGTSEP